MVTMVAYTMTSFVTTAVSPLVIATMPTVIKIYMLLSAILGGMMGRYPGFFLAMKFIGNHLLWNVRIAG